MLIIGGACLSSLPIVLDPPTIIQPRDGQTRHISHSGQLLFESWRHRVSQREIAINKGDDALTNCPPPTPPPLSPCGSSCRGGGGGGHLQTSFTQVFFLLFFHADIFNYEESLFSGSSSFFPIPLLGNQPSEKFLNPHKNTFFPLLHPLLTPPLSNGGGGGGNPTPSFPCRRRRRRRRKRLCRSVLTLISSICHQKEEGGREGKEESFSPPPPPSLPHNQPKLALSSPPSNASAASIHIARRGEEREKKKHTISFPLPPPLLPSNCQHALLLSSTL